MLRRLLKGAGVFAFGVVLIWVAFVISVRSRCRPVLDAVRRMNRAVTNPHMMKTAGEPGAFASVIEHVGRRTGTKYATPLQAFATPSGFDIALTYGTRTDWLLNVLASGTAVIVHDGTRYDVERPEIIPAPLAMPHVPSKFRGALRLYGIDQFLRVQTRARETPEPIRAAG